MNELQRHDPTRDGSILIVDDLEENLVGLEAILQDLGPPVFRARSGQDALRLLYDHDFAVILLDVRMPDMDGFETAQWIRRRERSRYTPIIFVTAADASAEDITRGYAAGAVDFLFKPFRPEVLKAKVSIFLELHRKSSELELSELRFRTLVANIPGAMYRCGTERPRLIQFISDPIERISGFPPADFISRRVLYEQIVHPEDLDLIEAAVEVAIRDRKPYAVDYRVLHREGQIRWVYDKGQPHFGDRGALQGLDGVIFDITDRKAAEDGLRLRTAELESINRELDSFCYTVSHDLRAPLRAMSGFSQALLEDYATSLDPMAKDYASRISDSARRMDSLIQDLLSYSRISRSEFPLAPTDVKGVLEEILKSMRLEIERRGAQVLIEDPLPPVQGNVLMLQLALGNFISNAVKFTPSGVPPRVRVSARRSAQHIRISVQDNGIGIDPEFHDRIFGVFQRLNPVSDYPGTGIGLAIARKAAERMGGSVGVESTPEKGSLFWIDLPALPERPTARSQAASEKTSAPESGQKTSASSL